MTSPCFIYDPNREEQFGEFRGAFGITEHSGTGVIHPRSWDAGSDPLWGGTPRRQQLK